MTPRFPSIVVITAGLAACVSYDPAACARNQHRLLFGLKGPNKIAQGTALGIRAQHPIALKGHNSHALSGLYR